MKNLLNSLHKTILVFIATGLIGLSSCKKDKADKQEAHGNPQVTQLVPNIGPGNELLTLTGTDIGEIRTIVFENGNVPAAFNPVFNTAQALLFRVPDTANGGAQNIIFTNVDGKSFKVPFTVIALPSVTTAYPTDFETNSIITLTGNNLESVSSVKLNGTSTSATVVTAEKKKLVIRMPASTVTSCKLDITNTSGSMTTTQVFTNLDQAYAIFRDGLAAGWDNWSWSLNITNSSTNIINGTASMKAEYTGAWGGMQLHANTPVNLTPYKFVTFWIKGADVNKNMKFNLNWANDQTLLIPANVWTYYKIDLDIFKNAGVTNFDTFVMQIHDDPKTLYLDNVILVK